MLKYRSNPRPFKRKYLFLLLQNSFQRIFPGSVLVSKVSQLFSWLNINLKVSSCRKLQRIYNNRVEKAWIFDRVWHPARVGHLQQSSEAQQHTTELAAGQKGLQSMWTLEGPGLAQDPTPHTELPGFSGKQAAGCRGSCSFKKTVTELGAWCLPLRTREGLEEKAPVPRSWELRTKSSKQLAWLPSRRLPRSGPLSSRALLHCAWSSETSSANMLHQNSRTGLWEWASNVTGPPGHLAAP